LNPLKKLASQTAVYGLPTIIGRLLNYLLNPLYAYTFSTSEMGIVTSAYSYVSFLLIFFTYGMETALFRFSQVEDQKQKVYTTALSSLFISSSVFVLIAVIFSGSIAEAVKFDGHPEYVTWFAIIIGTDALMAIPFAKLREQGRARRFAMVKLLHICVYIGLNLFFILFCKQVYDAPQSVFKPFVEKVYDPEIGIGYIFIANLVASLVTLLVLLPEMLKVKMVFETEIWKRMIRYAMPLLIAGLAGMINETLDRILLTQLLPEEEALSQTGIYGSCYKVSIIMTLFIQTFRFAAEPFFFSHFKEKDSKKTYAEIMKFFVIVCSFIFLGTMMNMQWIQYLAGSEEFRTGIKVVPILLLANMFLGIFWNQSIWYKLTGQTHYGALLTIFGAVITIVLNFYWIPRIGYMGCAWATLICYASMMLASYFMGNKHYPVDYDLKRILGYLGLSVALYIISIYMQSDSASLNLLLNNLFLVGFVFIVWKFDGQKLLAKL
jgi:O-antigen/teichoic acid export membrane protein